MSGKSFSGRVLYEFIVAMIGINGVPSLAQDRDYKYDTCRTCDTYSLYNRSRYGPNRNVL